MIRAFALFWMFLIGSSESFQMPHKHLVERSDPTRLFCICVDCARVTNCAAYHFVETKHEQPHMTEDPTFSPREGSPTIHVNVRTNRDDDLVARMWKDHEGETKKAEEAAAQSKEDTTDLHGETVYDLTPSTTVEYDVVACEDFVEDKGCWVRNMPEEIKQANPDFVPT